MADTNRFRVLAMMMQHVDPGRASEKGKAALSAFEAEGGGMGPADLGIDSSAFAEIVAQMEQEFGVKLPPEELATWGSLDDVMASLEKD